MKLIRWVLGRLILLWDAIFSPKTIERSAPELAKIQAKAVGLSIYQYEACPFCVKVRRHLRANKISLPLKDALTEPFRSELLAGGGKAQVPCLKIEQEGKTQWMYESSDIIAYLNTHLLQ